MARPYVNISNPSYNAGILSLDLWAFRVRGTDADDRSMSVDGFSQSLTQSFTLPLVAGTALGAFPDLAVTGPVTHTFSVGDLITSTANNGPGTEYTPATVTWTISGTAVPGDELTFGVDIEPNQFGITFSATFSATQVVALIGASFSSPVNGFEVETSGNQITLLATWGSFYNGLTSSLGVTSSTLSATTSDVQLAGGITTHNLSFVAPAYFGFDEKVQFQITA